MARRSRIDIEGGIHHVMNRGVDRQRIFFDDEDRTEFGRRLAYVHEAYGVDCLAYCLMDNHYHLLLRTPEGSLSEAMQHLGSTYTRHTNDRVGRDGPLFRGRFHSMLVSSDTYLMWVTRYIHRNPLDIAGVSSPRGYRWSSYRAYLGLRPSAPFLDTTLVAGLFSDDVDALVAFTEGSAPLLDSNTATIADLVLLVEFAVARDDLIASTDEKTSPWRVRTLMILLIEHVADATWRRRLLNATDAPTERARRMARSRAQQRLAADPSLQRILGTILAEFVAQDWAA